MEYFIYILIFSVNIYYTFIHKLKRIDRDNKYFEESENKKRKKLLNLLNFANISLLITNLIYYIVFLIYKVNIEFLDISFFIIHIITYTLFITSKNGKKLKNSKTSITEKKEPKILSTMYKTTFTSLILLQRVGELDKLNISIYIYFLIILLVIIQIIFIINFLISNKKLVKFNPNDEEEYLNDIKFSKKIYINSFYNYFIFIFAYILIVYINLPFSIIGYILIIVMLLLIIKNKTKKIKNQSDKLSKTIYILKQAPGVNYAFQFYRDILLTKKIILATIFFTISILTFYLIGMTAFSYISIEMYIILIYVSLIDKKKLIYNIYALNDNFIDKKIFKVEKELAISCIEKIKIFGVDFYKIIYNDISNNIYESNIILYDPESIINNIKIYLNPYNISNEYIIMIKELYE